MKILNDKHGIIVHADAGTGTARGLTDDAETSLFTVISTTKGSIPAPRMTTTQRDAIVSPEGGLVIYNTSTDRLESYDSTLGVWVTYGSGGGGTGKSYYDTADFSGSVPPSVVTYDDGAGAYVDGLGGSPSAISVAISGTTPEELVGLQSLEITKAAVSATGEGVTFTSTFIDRIDFGSRLYFSFAVDASDANYPGDIELYAYMSISGAGENGIIPVTLNGFEDNFIPAGFVGRLRGWIDFEATDASYAFQAADGALRFSFHIPSDSASGSSWSIGVDEMHIGPQEVVTVTPRVPAKDAGAITITATTTAPTKGTTVDVDKVTYSRDGEYAFITYDYYQASATGAAAGSGDYLFALPDGLVIDTAHPSYRADTSATEGRGGLCVGGGGMSGANQEWGTTAFIYDSTHVRITTFGAAGDHREEQYVSSTSFPLTTANVAYNFSIKVPIAGWQSNAVLGANQKTYRLSDLTQTRVTGADPTRPGQYRSRLRQASTTTYSDTNGAPGSPPTKADGFLLYGGNGWASADTNNQPSRYDHYIGKYKSYRVEYYRTTGKDGTGVIATPSNFGGTTGYGVSESYNPVTGILSIAVQANSAFTAGNLFGLINFGSTSLTDGYYDIIVGESPADLFIEQAKSSVTLDTGNGHGSTNTAIRRFTNSSVIGSGLTYADSATNGMSVTVNEPGIYTIDYNDRKAAGSYAMGLSLNSSALTTSIGSITRAQGKLVHHTTSGGTVHVNYTLRLSPGDIIRAHTDGTLDNATDLVVFNMTKIAI